MPAFPVCVALDGVQSCMTQIVMSTGTAVRNEIGVQGFSAAHIRQCERVWTVHARTMSVATIRSALNGVLYCMMQIVMSTGSAARNEMCHQGHSAAQMGKI